MMRGIKGRESRVVQNRMMKSDQIIGIAVYLAAWIVRIMKARNRAVLCICHGSGCQIPRMSFDYHSKTLDY